MNVHLPGEVIFQAGFCIFIDVEIPHRNKITLPNCEYTLSSVMRSTK